MSLKNHEHICKYCGCKFTPKRKIIKNSVCSNCKTKKVFKCSKCGTLETPNKRARKSTFVCSNCSKETKKLKKALVDSRKVPVSFIGSYLLEQGFVLSKVKQIPYKDYGNVRVALTSILDKPAIIVTSNKESLCFTDASVLKVLPTVAIIELKPLVNTVADMWKE